MTTLSKLALTQKSFITAVQRQSDALYYNHISIVVVFLMTSKSKKTTREFLEASQNNKLISQIGYIPDNYFLAYIARPVGHQNKARTIHQTINELFKTLKMQAPSLSKDISSSIMGISVVGLDSHNMHQAVNHALQATLDGSLSKKQRLNFFDSKLQHTIKRQILLEEFVKTAIENNQINVVFNPIVSCHSWAIEGYEVLSRFNSEPSLDTSTRELVDICEDLDLITELDLLTYQKALDELSGYIKNNDYFLNINISTNTRQNFTEFFSCINLLTDQYKMDRQKLVIDLNPSRSSVDLSVYEEHLIKLTTKGTKVALADLSSGFDLGGELAKEIYQYLRLDDRFCHKFHESSEYYQVVKLLVKLCHDLNVFVIVEGVDNIEQARLLTYLGVDYLQGSIFTFPVKNHEVETLPNRINSVVMDILNNSPSQEEHLVPRERKTTTSDKTLGQLARKDLPRLNPGDKLSLVYQYLKTPSIQVLPVIVDNVCVGIIDQEILNLHMTPAMGTKLETVRESRIWNKPVNTLMETNVQSAESSLSPQDLIDLIRNQNDGFPLIITDHGRYTGIISDQDFINYLVSQ
ncbi:EAL domain-containing protein [Vibrio salinus]|uniref:EAL domain-containing protein n=1 Tax=Vibrio salinus TaxID=2899784 RepID=UPI001E2C3528|nr:EAL domain-containing protein [Vibrio salinus]MCE0495365.1 EAL domain-containing protein [Vibrio salinus]